MALIRPFTGLRYGPKAGDIENLVAPPYDVLSQEERDEYAAKSPYNVVHLTLPEQREDDRSKFVKYARSAAHLAEWRREGVLLPEDSPVFYRYSQTFRIPGEQESFTRTALIGLLKTEPYEQGVVLPHEQTFPKHKEDRLRILEATRAHLECIFGLFEDDGGRVFSSIDRAPAATGAELTTEDGVRHRLDLIEDAGACQELSRALEDKKVWIADGHHRYETARAFREQLGERDGLIAEDFMMMAFSSMSDPGLVLLPTHRILAHLPVPEDRFDNLLQNHFNVRKVPNGRLMETIAALNAPDTRAFGISLPSGMGLVATLEEPEDALRLIEGDASRDLKLLDVTILHSVIFERLLGVKGLEAVSYTRDPDEAVQSVSQGADAAFLMNQPTVDDMRRIALGGEKMPQKSTYYYPKILSGLVLWSLADFRP
jgi:uncharacterized protein (DUF1015 family)